MESAPHLYSPDVANKHRVGYSDPAVQHGHWLVRDTTVAPVILHQGF